MNPMFVCISFMANFRLEISLAIIIESVPNNESGNETG